METQRSKIQRLKNQRGMLSVDFLFAITIAAGMIMMLFAFTVTLSMLEIGQYIAFSTARSYSVAHQDQNRQTAIARSKFESFTKSANFPKLSPLLSNGWFEIDQKSLDIRGGGQGSAGSGGLTFNEEYGYEGNGLPQEGIRFKLKAKILKMNIPFMGSIDNDDDFGTYITGFIFREPTADECNKSMAVNIRYSAIKALDSSNRFSRAISNVQAYGGHPGDRDYFPLEDNGC